MTTRLFQAQESIKLNLGCGSHTHPDWINMDFAVTKPGVIAHDLRTSLPFGDGTADVVYHSHVLEHLEKDAAKDFLRECFRVLKKGGVLRVVVPDLEQIARSYLTNLTKAQKGDAKARERYEWTVIELIDQMQRNFSGGEMGKYWHRTPMPAEDFVVARAGAEVKTYLTTLKSNNTTQATKTPSVIGKCRRCIGALLSLLGWPRSKAYEIGAFRLSGEIHQWMYDSYSLRALLIETGFREINKCAANQSRIKDFNNYFLDIDTDDSTRKPDSLFMEALK